MDPDCADTLIVYPTALFDCNITAVHRHSPAAIGMSCTLLSYLIMPQLGYGYLATSPFPDEEVLHWCLRGRCYRPSLIGYGYLFVRLYSAGSEYGTNIWEVFVLPATLLRLEAIQ